MTGILKIPISAKQCTKSLLKSILANVEWFDNISEQGYIVSEKEIKAVEQEEPEQEEYAVTAER